MPDLTDAEKIVRGYAGYATVGLNPAEGRTEDYRKMPFASGVLIKRDARVYIATVAHYLEQVPLHEMTITFSPKRTEYASNDREMKAKMATVDRDKDLTRAVKLDPLWHLCGTASEDVAVIEIDPAKVPGYIWVHDVTKYGELRKKPEPGERVLLTGLPVKHHVVQLDRPLKPGEKPTGWMGRALNTIYYNTIKVEDPDRWRSEDYGPGFIPEYHFAIEYPLALKEAPRGLSGGGIWRVNLEKTEAGAVEPAPVLVGIESSYYAPLDCLKATSVRNLLKLFERPNVCAKCGGRR